MADARFRLHTKIMGAGLFGRPGQLIHLGLKVGQPLLLEMERDNPVDPHAVRLLDLFGRPVGYVMRPKSSVVWERMAYGECLLAKVFAPARLVRRPAGRPGLVNAGAVIWSDGTTVDRTVYTEHNNPCRDVVLEYGL